jgi:phosphoglucosamine mutase
MRDFATTGDGILTGLHLLSEMARQGKTLAELARVMTVYPQVMVNVKNVDHHAVHTDEGLQTAVKTAESALGDTGRVLLRPSGTEPLVRVMVEAADQVTAERLANELADVVRERLAL